MSVELTIETVTETVVLEVQDHVPAIVTIDTIPELRETLDDKVDKVAGLGLRDDLSDAYDENKGASLVGFRGETVRSSLVRRSQFYESGSTDILIISGQSNAAGYAAMSDGAPSYLTDLAKMWDGTKLIPITAYTPTPYQTSTGSAWAAFANEYCDNTGRRLVIVNCAQGSRSIADLQKGGANYSNMIAWVDGVKSAITASGGVVARVLVAFNHGEQDYSIGTTYDVYL